MGPKQKCCFHNFGQCNIKWDHVDQVSGLSRHVTQLGFISGSVLSDTHSGHETGLEMKK